ncbi:MAG: LysE family transporter [Chloroflexi bacterium]|nr:LysE family transporter [Chloroflexota bacterium]
MLSTAIAGAIIAISFSAPPGPVALETIRRGLRGGFGPALRVQLGSIIGDLTWCIAALIGLAPLAQIDFFRNGLGIAGVGLLVYLGAMGMRDALKQTAIQATADARDRQGAFRTGAAISMANPMAVGYWLSVGGALVAGGVVGGNAGQTTAFITGFLSGVFLWAFIMALAVRFGKQMLNPLAFRIITFACGATMIIFGFTLASQMFGALL